MKNKLQKDLFCFCLLFCLSLFGMYGGCGKNNSPDGSSDHVTKQKIFPDRKNKIEVTEQSPIQGTTVIFEKNSIKRPQIVSISPADKPSKLPSQYKAAGKLVRFSTNGSSRFAKPVLVKLPYPDSDQDTSIDGSTISETQTKVLYWDDSMNKWQTKEVIGIEKQNNLAKFETTHFSVYLTAIQEQNEDITDDNENQFLTGESFIGVPEFSWTQDTETGEWQKQMTDPGGGPEYMTVRRNETNLQAVVGPFITTGTSHPATINTPNFTSATFNASNIYPKVAQSGDAQSWNWQCDFVSEHTHLENYEAVDERLQEPGEDAIFCQTEIVNSNLVRLIWSINANQEIDRGDRLVIEFMATYAE